MVNQCFPPKMRDAFSGVPAIKKFFMDRLHLLDFLERGLRRFPVKMLQRQYHVPIMFLSGLYQVFLQSMTYFSICRKCRITDFPFFSKTSLMVCHFGLPVRSNDRGKNSKHRDPVPNPIKSPFPALRDLWEFCLLGSVPNPLHFEGFTL